MALTFLLIYGVRDEKGSEIRSGSINNALHHYVMINGDVEHPGVYSLPANSMADGVIKLAIGRERFSSVETEKLAAMPISNGDLLDVRLSNGLITVTKGSMTVAERLIMKIPLDISGMNEDDFLSLPGVGVTIADRIMEYRQKNGGLLMVEDLINVEGIGDKKFNELRKYFK